MPDPGKDAAIQVSEGRLVPRFADVLENCDLDRVYTADELRAALNDLSDEPLLEGGE
jgi:hypothetical protein